MLAVSIDTDSVSGSELQTGIFVHWLHSRAPLNDVGSSLWDTASSPGDLWTFWENAVDSVTFINSGDLSVGILWFGHHANYLVLCLGH